MRFQDSIKTCFSKYAEFKGRASRSEYWWFVLFSFIAQAATAAISQNLSYAIAIGLILPSIAVGVRRLHDKDKSGWWMLLHFVPLIGAIVLLVWFCQKGTEGTNRFGDIPSDLQITQQIQGS